MHFIWSRRVEAVSGYPLPMPDTDGVASRVESRMHGCEAYNYDASAEGDDGSCEYETLIQVDMTGLPIDNAGVMWPALSRMESVNTPMELGQTACIK